MKEFLDKLFNSENELSLLLLEAKAIADDFDDENLKDFITKEINGYEGNIPEYRKINAEIVADIQNIYGQIQYKSEKIDFSLLSEKVGLDLEVSYIPDGISFIETAIKGLTRNTAIKPIPKPLIKMLDETFHYNNQHLHIVAAYHKMPTTALKFILSKVRQELIKGFQRLANLSNKSNFNTIGTDNIEEATPTKKIFVTYAWEDENHNSKIISFVNFLREKGFDASMDRKNSQNETAINFNKMAAEGIQNADKVIVVLTEKYKHKANKFEDGVGFEYQMILEDIKQNTNKYILVSFGELKLNKITPTGLTGRDVLNLKIDQDENNFNTLFAKIKQQNIIEFIDVSSKDIEIVKLDIKPFKL